MVTRLNIEDADAVRRIAMHPEVFGKIKDDGGDDGTGECRVVRMLESDQFFVLGWRYDEHLVGLWILHPWNAVMYQAHVCILPGYRGHMAVAEGQGAAAYMFNASPCRKIMALVPKNNMPACLYARSVGMKREGVVTSSFLQGGDLHDQVLYGLNKED